MEREEGEMSDDNTMIVDEEMPQTANNLLAMHTVTYKADKNGAIVQKLEKIDAVKLEERAIRFGLNLQNNKVVTQREIDELYANFGIESGNERHFRFDSIHIHGVDGLTTRDIFEYLEDFKPVSLEWIDNISCNIVCQDHISAALALLVHSREIKNEELIDMLSKKSPHHWREGMPHPQKDLILMRFATNGDKKMTKKIPEKITNDFYDETMDFVNKDPWGDLCKSWGVYDHQETFQRSAPTFGDDDDPPKNISIKNKKLAMRLGKRNHKYEENDDSSSDSEWKKKSKVPRMRMHADDEESKLKKRPLDNDSDPPNDDVDAYAPLSVEVVNSKTNNYSPRVNTKLSDKFKLQERFKEKRSIQSRLGSKVTEARDECSSDESSADSTDHNVMSRVQKINPNLNPSANSSVWSRLEAKNYPKEEQSDLRRMLKSKRQNKADDLRQRLGKSKQSNLRIEIDNNYSRS